MDHENAGIDRRRDSRVVAKGSVVLRGRARALRHAPQSLRLGLLELAGMTTTQALDKLGIGRTHRARVIAGRRWLPILVHRRRSLGVPVSVTPGVPISVHHRRSAAT